MNIDFIVLGLGFWAGWLFSVLWKEDIWPALKKAWRNREYP